MDTYLSLYVSQEEHRNNHLQSKPTLTPQEKTFISSHLSSTPNIIASKMMSMDMIDSSQLSDKRKLIHNYVHNTKKRMKNHNNKVEWNLDYIKRAANAVTIDINSINCSLLTRSLDPELSFLRNIYIISHDLNKGDEWSYIIFTICSAIDIILNGNIDMMWGDDKVCVYLYHYHYCEIQSFSLPFI